MTRESSRTTGERCSFFSRKSGVFAVAVAYRKSGLWTYGRQSGRTCIAEAPVVRTFRVCAKKCDISASRVLSKHTSKLTRLCEKTRVEMILFLFILFHTTWEQKGFGRLPLWASVDIFQSVTVEGIRNEKWRSFWTREMREGRARECEWKAFSFYFTFLFERLLRRLFSSWKEFLLRSLHIFVKLCKLGSNVKSAPKTSVHSVPEQDPVVRNVDNAISLSSG